MCKQAFSRACWGGCCAVVLLGCSSAWAADGLRTEVVAKGLQNPWGLAFIGDGRMLVTERPGRMRVVQADGQVGAPLAGLPPVEAVGQGGLAGCDHRPRFRAQPQDCTFATPSPQDRASRAIRPRWPRPGFPTTPRGWSR